MGQLPSIIKVEFIETMTTNPTMPISTKKEKKKEKKEEKKKETTDKDNT